MKLIFFGTPDYVIPVLEALKQANYEIAAVVTQPPKPVGRKKILTPSPVAQWAEKEKIRIIDDSPSPKLQRSAGRPKNILEELREIGAPAAVLAAYGRIIPQSVIDTFQMGILNIHPSLLPKYRGAIPVEAALVAGETETGVTIIKLDAEMDHGPILAQEEENIKPDDDRITLRKRLFEKGAKLITKVLPEYLGGKLEPKEQDHDEAIYVTLFKKDHGFIPPEYLDLASQGVALQAQWEIPFIQDFTIDPSPQTIDRFIRAVNPWPGAWTQIKVTRNSEHETRRLKILKAHIESQTKDTSGVSFGSPRDIAVGGNSIYLVLDEVQLEGKNPVTFEQFRKGYPNFEFKD